MLYKSYSLFLIKELKTIALDNKLKEMYDVDYLQWLENTVDLLKQNKFEELDLDNLIEELIDLEKQEKRRAKNLLEQIIIHLLLYQYWEARRQYDGSHWRAEIRAFRHQLNDDLTTNLLNLLTEKQEKQESIYNRALGYVREKTNLNIFPQECPYILEQLLDVNWYPEI